MAVVVDDPISIGTERSRFRLPVDASGILPARYVRRAGLKEWDSRDASKTKLPVATLVVDVSGLLDRKSGELKHDSDQVEKLYLQGLVPAYFVIGHAKADGRPLCVRIGDPTDPLIPADLPLFPLKP